MFVCATDDGVCLLEFTDKKRIEAEFKDLEKRFKAEIIQGTNKHIDIAINEVKDYMDGALNKFTVTLDMAGTDFQKNVWMSLNQIPFGETRSYKEQAIKIGKPKAVRAVANANGMNKIALIIPCHRVIGSNGALTGYAGGLQRKKWLLDLERNYLVE